MIRPVSCFGCGMKTKIFIRKVRTKYKESIIVLHNAPVHFCVKCNEVMVPFEVLMTFKYAKTLELKQGINEFDFGYIYTQMKGSSTGKG